MTTFEQQEESTEQSRPIELYAFALGAESFRFTSSEDAITLGVVVYEPESISRSNVVSGRDERNRALEIRLPSRNAFASRWKSRPPGIPGSATVIRLQRGEVPFGTTQVVLFKGLVRAVQFPEEGREAVVGVTSIEAAANRPMPRFTFSAQCNHFLYDQGCKAPTAGHVFTGTVTAENGSQITVPGAGAFSSKFAAGFVRPQAGNDVRLVRSQAGDVLTLSLPFGVSVLGDVVDVFEGCDHLIAGDCLNLYNNVIENGGFPFVPLKNPFETGL